MLTEYIVNEGIIRAVRHSKSKVVFFYDKNHMTKTESYDLLSNIYSRFFAGNMPMNNFVSLGCKLFDCYEKKNKVFFHVYEVLESVNKDKWYLKSWF